MTTRWREPSNPSETIAKAWLENQDRRALELASTLLDSGKQEDIDGVMIIIDEEGGPEAFEELAEAWTVLAESNASGCLVVFPFEAGRLPDAVTLRLSLKSVLKEFPLVLHPKALEPQSLLELPPYLLRSALVSLLEKGKTTGLPWTVHSGKGPGVFLGALACPMEDAAQALDQWLKDEGAAMGAGIACAPSGMHLVLDRLEMRRVARLRAQEELDDFLCVAAEECAGKVTAVRTTRDGVVWVSAVNLKGEVIDSRAFADLPDDETGRSGTPANDEALPSGRRGGLRGGLRVIRGGGA